tara:strand:+ start:1007 stop:1645 length:639 start_codon:yes stop_codon:yes gene_type:complete
MSKTVPDFSCILVEDGTSVDSSTVGFNTVFGGGWAISYHQGYFDLSGYSIQDKTVYPASVMTQEFSAFKGLAQEILVVDLVTTHPLSPSDLTVFSAFVPFQPQLPGAPLSTHNLEEIISGSMRVLTKNQNLPVTTVYQEIWRSGWGTGTATAAEKLYYTRAYYWDPTSPGGGAGASLIAPALAYVVPMEFDKEGDVEYMMRLKRSYELANEG